jgi:hypothetical protein
MWSTFWNAGKKYGTTPARRVNQTAAPKGSIQTAKRSVATVSNKAQAAPRRNWEKEEHFPEWLNDYEGFLYLWNV